MCSGDEMHVRLKTSMWRGIVLMMLMVDVYKLYYNTCIYGVMLLWPTCHYAPQNQRIAITNCNYNCILYIYIYIYIYINIYIYIYIYIYVCIYIYLLLNMIISSKEFSCIHTTNWEVMCPYSLAQSMLRYVRLD